MHPPPDTPSPTAAASRFFAAHWRIGRTVHDYVNPLLEQTHGLSYRDFLVLAAISRGVRYPTEVAERLRLPKDTTSRILQTLLQAGLVERAIDTQDSRRTRLETTPAGLTLHNEVRGSIEGLLEPFLAGLGDAQEQFLELLETLSDQLAASPELSTTELGTTKLSSTAKTPALTPVGE